MTKVLGTTPTLLLELHPTICQALDQAVLKYFSFLAGHEYDFYLIDGFRKNSAIQLEQTYNF
jgi:hypothetical protein